MGKQLGATQPRNEILVGGEGRRKTRCDFAPE